jgi:hypothetical protein
MKHPLYLLLILFAGLSIRAIAQNSDPVSLIILNNGDSLFNKEILKDVNTPIVIHNLPRQRR